MSSPTTAAHARAPCRAHKSPQSSHMPRALPHAITCDAHSQRAAALPGPPPASPPHTPPDCARARTERPSVATAAAQHARAPHRHTLPPPPPRARPRARHAPHTLHCALRSIEAPAVPKAWAPAARVERCAPPPAAQRVIIHVSVSVSVSASHPHSPRTVGLFGPTWSRQPSGGGCEAY